MVGFLLSVLRRHVRKLALATVLLLIGLCLGLGLNNVVQSSSSRTVLRRKLSVTSSHFLEVDCWREAALLVIRGLSLFNGSLPAYGSFMEAISQKRLIRERVKRAAEERSSRYRLLKICLMNFSSGWKVINIRAGRLVACSKFFTCLRLKFCLKVHHKVSLGWGKSALFRFVFVLLFKA